MVSSKNSVFILALSLQPRMLPSPRAPPQIISSRTPNEAARLGQRRQIRCVLPAPFCQDRYRFGAGKSPRNLEFFPSVVTSYCPKSSDYVHVSRKGIVLGRLRDAEMFAEFL